MKKIFIILIAVMLSVFTVIGLAACSAPNSMLDDAEDKNEAVVTENSSFARSWKKSNGSKDSYRRVPRLVFLSA